MFNHFTEIMLKSYFLAVNTVARFNADRRKLFQRYADIFLLSDAEQLRLFTITESKAVKEISSEREYHQYRRLKEYLSMNANEKDCDPEVDEIIDIKGAAFTLALNERLLRESKDSKSVACANLTLAAENGLVIAMMTLGILQVEGVVYDCDIASGLDKIGRAADWCNEESIFAAMYYMPEKRERYAPQLHWCLQQAGYADSFRRVVEVYGHFDGENHREHLLLEKAFAQGIVKRDIYTKTFARLIYSEVLSERDKEALALTPNKELFAEACTLPLKLGMRLAETDKSVLDDIRPKQEIERNRVGRLLENAEFRQLPTYRPMCFISESKYMLDYYSSIVSKFFTHAHIERIEAADLSDHNFEPTINNIFVRSCEEDYFNVFFLFFRGQIGEKTIEMMHRFLQSSERSKFRLNRPSVSLDLSSVLPVCFCDKENSKKLKFLCETVHIAELTSEEKEECARDILQVKTSIYGSKKYGAQDGVFGHLKEFGIDDIEKILDCAIRDHRADDGELTDDILRPYCENIRAKRGTTYGFGGTVNENQE